MFSRLRRDPVINAQTMLWGGVVALNTGVLAGLMTLMAAGSTTWALGPKGSFAFLATLAWLSIFPFLLLAKARERCQPIDMVLPVSARKLWLSHIVVLTLLGLAFLALIAGVLRLHFWALGKPPLDFSVLNRSLEDLILPVSVCLVLVVVLLQSTKPALYRIPGTVKYFCYSIFIVGSAFGLILVLSVLSPLALLIPFSLTLLFGYRTYRSIPPAFTIVPLNADPAEAPAAPDHVGARDWELHDSAKVARGIEFGWILFRLLFINPVRKKYAAIFYFPLFLLWGFSLSGFLSAWKDLDLPQFSYAFLTGLLLLSPLTAQISRLPLIDPLPISRKFLFAWLMLPSLLAMVIGLGGGSIGTAFLEKSKLLVQYQAADSGYFPPYRTKSPLIRVPGQYCKIAWDGQPPESISPWGESHPAWKYPLFRGSRITVYSPFNTPEGCSAQFAALQMSRAIQAVYGKSVPYQEVLDHYLEAGDGRGITLKKGGLALFNAYPNLRPQGEIALFPVLMLMIGVAWLLMTAVYLRACRATVTHAGRMKVFYGMAAAATVSAMGQVALMVAGFARPHVGAAFLVILLRELAMVLPGGNFTLWIICALFLLGAYRLAQVQFQRIEMLPGQSCR